MNVCILGANGYLGSYLTNNLVDYNIIPVTRDTHDIFSYSKVKDFLKTNKIDVIINCAFHGGSVKDTDIKINLETFLNFYNNSYLFDHYINIGSGAELFGTDKPRKEEHLTNFCDLYGDDYAFTKNIISRMCLEKDNFTTLRLFGCFDRTEPDYRLFKKLLNKEVHWLDNILFDYISAKDFTSIVKLYIENKNKYFKDLNCVYNSKYNLQNIVEYFFKVNNIKKYNFRVCNNKSSFNYIGDGSKLHSLPIELEGLWEGLKNYA